ncbi:hypothetical protein ZEAMMB73_Zm00001d007519, partial [Zea mays]
MATPRHLPLHLILVVVAAAAFVATGTARTRWPGWKSAGAPSAACCAAYEAAFDADPFCLCYVGRATGDYVDVARALQIPARCGQVQPPIELCS